MYIQVLPPNVSAQIAAGEVVERPASVVKELVENALKADTTQISVSIEQDGTKSIRVQDNGSGIPGDRAEAVFSQLLRVRSELRDSRDH